MHKHVLQALEIHNTYYGLFTDLIAFLAEVREVAKHRELTLTEYADMVYVLKQVHLMHEEMRKELRAVFELCEKIGVAMWIDEDTGETPIRGEFTSSTPEIRPATSIPTLKNDPENYAKLMEYLGIPESTYRNGIIQPYFPEMMQHIKVLMMEGKPLPPGIKSDQVNQSVFSFVSRKKKGVDLLNYEPKEPEAANIPD